jgi:hypothetical protein
MPYKSLLDDLVKASRRLFYIIEKTFLTFVKPVFFPTESRLKALFFLQ